MKKSLENLQLDYVDLYLIHLPVGCKYKEGNVGPYFDDKGEVVTEGKTDHAALWKVLKIFTFSTKTFRQYLLKTSTLKLVNLQKIEMHMYRQP